MKRDRTRAFLTEFLIFIIFFAVASVIAVSLFTAASKKSKEAINLAKAESEIQKTVEKILDSDSVEDAQNNYEQEIYYNNKWSKAPEKEADYKVVVTYQVENGTSGDMLNISVSAIDINKGRVLTSINTSKYFAK